MKILSHVMNIRFYFKLLASLGILLLLITVGQSLLEYRSSQSAILNMFQSQSETLITSIARAGEKGLIAYQSIQAQVISNLFSITRMIELNSNGNINDISRAIRDVGDESIA